MEYFKIGTFLICWIFLINMSVFFSTSDRTSRIIKFVLILFSALPIPHVLKWINEGILFHWTHGVAVFVSFVMSSIFFFANAKNDKSKHFVNIFRLICIFSSMSAIWYFFV